MNDTDICQKCNKPKSSSEGGIVTQYIDVCRCGEIHQEQSETISVCSNCGMRIPKRSGSITQWIFGQGTCRCKKPTPEEKPVEEFINPSFIGFRDSKNESYLDLDADKFPIERYLPIDEIGKGAAGKVYLCRDKILGKKVAVKVLLDLTPEQLISFQEEAKALAKLDHPNIVKIIDFGASQSETPYMVMDFIAGISLETYLERHGTLEESAARNVFAKLCKALDYAHKQGVFHRDIKPSNILLYEQDELIEVCLIDFGVAKVKEATGLITVYQDKTLAGTPDYMSPDPIQGDSYDEQSEIYCLGCVLFETLAGRPPFTADTALETLSLHVRKTPPRLKDIDIGISEEISDTVSRCLEKSKAKRFSSMEELIEQLSSIQKIRDATPLDTQPHASKSLSSSKIPVIPLIAVILVLIFSAPLLFLFSGSKHTASEKADKKAKQINVKFRPSQQRSAYDYYEPFLSNNSESDLDLKRVRKELEKRIEQYSIHQTYRDMVVMKRRFLNGKLSIKLDLSNWKIDGSGLAHLENLPIDGLILSDNTKLQNIHLVHLISIPLTHLALERTNLNGKGLESVTKIESLSTLSLNSCENLKEEDFEILSNLKELRSIDLSQTAVSDKALENLSHCRKLHSIYLNNTKITNRGLDALSKLKSVDHLYLANCKGLDAEAIKIIAKNFPSIRYLSLISLKAESDDLLPLAQCKELIYLNLSGIPIADSCLQLILKNTRLSYLYLHGAKITDKTLTNLADSKYLRTLTLTSCPEITSAGIEKLKAKLSPSVILQSDKVSSLGLDSNLYDLFERPSKEISPLKN